MRCERPRRRTVLRASIIEGLALSSTSLRPGSCERVGGMYMESSFRSFGGRNMDDGAGVALRLAGTVREGTSGPPGGEVGEPSRRSGEERPSTRAARCGDEDDAEPACDLCAFCPSGCGGDLSRGGLPLLRMLVRKLGPDDASPRACADACCCCLCS